MLANRIHESGYLLFFLRRDDYRKTKIELFVSDENHPIYKISLNVDSYKGKLEYVWNVNMNSKEIQAASSDAKQILDIVNYYD